MQLGGGRPGSRQPRRAVTGSCHIDTAQSDAEQSKLGSCFRKSSYAAWAQSKPAWASVSSATCCWALHRFLPQLSSVMLRADRWLLAAAISHYKPLVKTTPQLHRANVALPAPVFLVNRLLFILQNTDCKVTRSGKGMSHGCCWDSLILPDVCGSNWVNVKLP